MQIEKPITEFKLPIGIGEVVYLPVQVKEVTIGGGHVTYGVTRLPAHDSSPITEIVHVDGEDIITSMQAWSIQEEGWKASGVDIRKEVESHGNEA